MSGQKTNSYIKRIIKELNFALESSAPENKIIGQNILDQLLGIENKYLDARKYSPRELFASHTLYTPLSEIMKSFHSLENIKIYIGSFPYKNNKIKKDDYLRYHLENYLNELYILKNRLIAYIDTLIKAYNKSQIKDNVNKHFPEVVYFSK